jgi:malonate transporter
MKSDISLLDTLLPLYLLISLGYIFKQRTFLSVEFWVGVEKLVYYILFPALIFSNLARAEVDPELIKQILLGVAIPTFIVGASQWAGFLDRGLRRETFSSMYQGAVRNNTTIGLVIAGLIMPGHGVAVMALIMTIMVIINNISCVTVLARYGNAALRESSGQKRSMLRSVASNPLIIASIAGLTFNFSSIRLPDSLHSTIYFLGQTGLPLALLAVGAGLKLAISVQKLWAISLSTLAKLALMPALIYLFIPYIGLDVDDARIFVLYGALPTAMSSYVLSSQLGGDKQSMAQIITVQTLLAALSLPLVLILLQGTN